MGMRTNVPLEVLVDIDKIPTSTSYIKSGLVQEESTVAFHFSTKELAKFS